MRAAAVEKCIHSSSVRCAAAALHSQQKRQFIHTRESKRLNFNICSSIGGNSSSKNKLRNKHQFLFLRRVRIFNSIENMQVASASNTACRDAEVSAQIIWMPIKNWLNKPQFFVINCKFIQNIIRIRLTIRQSEERCCRENFVNSGVQIFNMHKSKLNN